MTDPGQPSRRHVPDDLEAAWAAVFNRDSVAVQPSMAGVWSALRQGLYSFSADRAITQRLLDAYPGIRLWAAAHDLFRTEAIAALLARGCAQFIDLGCGFPDMVNTHDELRSSGRDVRLVCVDGDPVVTELGRNMYQRDDAHVRTTVLTADLRDPDLMLSSIVDTNGVDFAEPVAVIVTAVLQHLDDLAAARLLAAIRARVVTGSWLILSHPAPPAPTPLTVRLDAAFSHYEATIGPLYLRDSDHAVPLLGVGWTPVAPGITQVGSWQPHTQPRYDPGDGDTDLQHVAGWAVLARAASAPAPNQPPRTSGWRTP